MKKLLLSLALVVVLFVATAIPVLAASQVFYLKQNMTLDLTQTTSGNGTFYAVIYLTVFKPSIEVQS